MISTEIEIDMLDELVEFRPRLSPVQNEQLRESLKSEGMKTGIVLCTIGERPGKHYILDGHEHFWEAESLGIPLKIDTEKSLHFDNADAALMWAYKSHATKRNLTVEQFNLLLACYYECYCRRYRSRESQTAAHQCAPRGQDQKDSETSAAEIVAVEFGVSPAKVIRAAAKVELIDSLNIHVAIMDGTFKSVSKRTLEAFLKAANGDPHRRSDLVQAAMDAADANGGRMLPPEKTVEDDPELEGEEPYDPEAERALDERTTMIEWLIRKAREEWDECYVERLERKVLEAFTTWPVKPQVIPATEC